MLPNAIKNARKLQKYNKTTGVNNPSTNVHELIEYLTSLNTRQI